MRVRTLTFAAVLSIALPAVSATWLAGADDPPEDPAPMQLVVLTDRGGVDEPSTHSSVRLERAQQRYFTLLLEGDHVVLAGKVAGDGPIRRVALFDVGSVDRAREIVQGSPSVGAGRLEARVYELSTARRELRRPPDPSDLVTCHLGMLLAAGNPSGRSAAEVEALREAHAATVRELIERPDVVLAGEVDGDDDLSEILLFSSGSARSIEAAFAEDPAVQAGLLELEVLPWQVPRGAFGAS